MTLQNGAAMPPTQDTPVQTGVKFLVDSGIANIATLPGMTVVGLFTGNQNLGLGGIALLPVVLGISGLFWYFAYKAVSK